eukprot:gene15126-20360_t
MLGSSVSCATKILPFEDWVNTNFGGFESENIMGMKVPVEVALVPQLFDQAFARFQPIVEIGKKKFAGGNILNTATTKEELVQHADLLAPHFVAFMENFVKFLESEDTQFNAGINNEHLKKSGEGLDFRLMWKEPRKLHDMLRGSLIGHSITSLQTTIRKFLAFCSEHKKDTTIFNVYDNIFKFGDIDRANVDHIFGYVGVHVSIPFTVSVPPNLYKLSNSTIALKDGTDGEITTDLISEKSICVNNNSDDGVELTNDKKRSCEDNHNELPSNKKIADINAPDSSCVNSISISFDEITMVAEVQFHPSTIFDGTSTCIKEQFHYVYRAFNNGEMEEMKKNEPEKAVKLRAAYEISTREAKGLELASRAAKRLECVCFARLFKAGLVGLGGSETK